MERLPKHPISIISIFPVNLSIKANEEPNPLEGRKLVYSIQSAHNNYNLKKKTIIVRLKFEIAKEEEQELLPPYEMIVELVARFKVDEKKFSVDNIEDWANRNAPIVMYPYLRERVYALTIQAGFKPLLLPLVEVPTFKIEKKMPPSKNNK